MSTTRVSVPIAGLAGVAAVAAGAGVGELVGSLIAPESRPFAVVGGALIDLAPAWAKDAAIALFGTADKIALLVGIGIVAIGLAFFAGWLQSRFPPWGVVLVALVGAGGAIVAVTRADAGELAWVPAATAGGVGAVTLWGLIRMLRPREPGTSDGSAPSRRAFFAMTGVALAVGAFATIAASARRAGGAAVEAVRSAVRLPTAAAAASPVPSGAELDIPGLARVVTPNDQFYRIDTALIVPEIDPADWSLRVHGMVENEVVLTWDELLALPLGESWTTLACVSNEVGGTLIGNAKWLGYPIRALLDRARPTAEADMVLSRSIDGFTASTPLDVLTDDRDAILAVGMNGEPLPLQHGFPVRMVVPGLYGYVSATKWVVDYEVTRFGDV
ncbi:MAG: molybdopterin-dependent oxidoreductase, partial [Microbacterium sp.]